MVNFSYVLFTILAVYPRPISTPIANSIGSAGTMAPRMITASQNAIRNMTTPAATGWAPIQATRLSNQALTGEIMAAGVALAPPTMPPWIIGVQSKSRR